MVSVYHDQEFSRQDIWYQKDGYILDNDHGRFPGHGEEGLEIPRLFRAGLQSQRHCFRLEMCLDRVLGEELGLPLLALLLAVCQAALATCLSFP